MKKAIKNKKETKPLKCSLCGYRYQADQAQPACRKCPMSRFCKLVRCPNCGL